MTIIREATAADVPGIQAMAAEFLAASRYGTLLAVTPDQVTNLVGLVQTVGGLILVAEDDGALVGLLALVVGPHPLTGELLADEVAWWVTPAARYGRVGVRLLQAAEAWALDQGVVWFVLIEPLPVSVEGRYGRFGYTVIEARSIKRLDGKPLTRAEARRAAVAD